MYIVPPALWGVKNYNVWQDSAQGTFFKWFFVDYCHSVNDNGPKI